MFRKFSCITYLYFILKFTAIYSSSYIIYKVQFFVWDIKYYVRARVQKILCKVCKYLLQKKNPVRPYPNRTMKLLYLQHLSTAEKCLIIQIIFWARPRDISHEYFQVGIQFFPAVHKHTHTKLDDMYSRVKWV